jgi:hypothetical protein
MTWEERFRDLGLSQKMAKEAAEKSWEERQKQLRGEAAILEQRFEPLIKKMAGLLNFPLIKQAENQWRIKMHLGNVSKFPGEIKIYVFPDYISLSYRSRTNSDGDYGDLEFIKEISLKKRNYKSGKEISPEDMLVQEMEMLVKCI